MSKNTYSEELYQAIVNEDKKKVSELLSQNGDLNTTRRKDSFFNNIDFENIYPIEIACKTSADMAKILINAGAKVDVIDPYLSSTPLIYTLSSNYEERFEVALKLIDRGANIDQVDRNGRTALNKAAIVFSEDGEKARQNEIKLMKYLLDNGDISKIIKDSDNNPLVEAAGFDNVEVIKLILDNGYLDIDIKSKGYTPLMKASMTGSVNACRLLIERGANKEIQSPKGKTAYEYAMEKGNQEIIDCFRK